MEKSLYYIGKKFQWCLRFRYITAELAGNCILLKFWKKEPYFSEGRWSAGGFWSDVRYVPCGQDGISFDGDQREPEHPYMGYGGKTRW